MQYKLFSTNKEYLPIEPQQSTETTIPSMVLDQQVNGIELAPLSIVNGVSTIYKHVGIAKDSNCSYLINNNGLRRKVDAVASMIEVFKDLEYNALIQLQVRTELEQSSGHIEANKAACTRNASVVQKRMIQSYLESKSTKDRGYIVWIIEKESLPPISSLKPTMIDLTEGIELSNVNELEYQNELAQQQGADSTSSSQRFSRSYPQECDVELPVTSIEEPLSKRRKTNIAQQLTHAREIVAVARRAMAIIKPAVQATRDVSFSFLSDVMGFDGK